MKNMKIYLIAITIAVIAGVGIYNIGVSPNSQYEKQRKDREDTQNKAKENEVEENEAEEVGEENEADEQTRLAKEAGVTREKAEAIALREVPGTIVDGELEKEDGKLIYSFDIRNTENQTSEVEVNAKTGKLVNSSDKDGGE